MISSDFDSHRRFSYAGFFLLESLNWKEWQIGLLILIITLISLCTCLILMVKVLSSIFKGPIAKFLTKIINYNLPKPFQYFTGYIVLGVSVNLLDYFSFFIGSICKFLCKKTLHGPNKYRELNMIEIIDCRNDEGYDKSHVSVLTCLKRLNLAILDTRSLLLIQYPL